MKKKTWGGRRVGAGRKKKPGRSRVVHRTRPALATLSPVHVTLRMVDGLPTLRSLKMAGALNAAFAGGKERPGFRVVHFSVMKNHMHLVVEADDRTSLSSGMQGLMVRMAHHLNRALLRRGKVFADRFHSRALGSTVDVRNTLLYVLNNARRHGIALAQPIDPYSSGAWFTGWCEEFPLPLRASPVAAARSWQLRDGWLLHGRLDPHRVPAAGSVCDVLAAPCATSRNRGH